MKVYLATSYKNRKTALRLMQMIEDHGHTITWWWPDVEDSDLGACAKNDADGICEADALVLVPPLGFGCHTELGIAIGRNIPIFMVGRCPDNNIFLNHPCVRYCNSWKALFQELARRKGDHDEN